MAEREEIIGGKRIVREHDADGKLLRIHILPYTPPPADAPPGKTQAPLRFGRTQEAPAGAVPPARKVEPVVAPVQAGAVPPAGEAAPPAAPVQAGAVPPARKAPGIHVRFRDEPDQPGIDVVVSPFHEPRAPLPPPAPRALPVEVRPSAPARGIHVRFAGEAPAGDVDVVVAPLPEHPAPALPIAPREPAPAPVVFREPEPVVVPVEITPAPEPVVALAPPEAEPEMVRYAPLPRFEIVALEPVVAPRGPEPEPEPVKVAPAEPEPVEERVEPEPVVDVPPKAYLRYVPDVDSRVDALLARVDAPAKRRKRAPIPAPAFEPLQREPWEDRLDAALAGR